MSQDVHWRRNPLIWLIAVSALFSVGGVAVMFRGMEGDILGGCIILAIFVPATVVFTRRLLSPAPRLTLDDQGIFDSRLGVGVVPWAELADAHVLRMRRHTFLCLVPRDPARWTAKLSPLRRLMALGDTALGAAVLNVSLNGIDCVPAELEATARRHIAAAAPR